MRHIQGHEDCDEKGKNTKLESNHSFLGFYSNESMVATGNHIHIEFKERWWIHDFNQ